MNLGCISGVSQVYLGHIFQANISGVYLGCILWVHRRCCRAGLGPPERFGLADTFAWHWVRLSPSGSTRRSHCRPSTSGATCARRRCRCLSLTSYFLPSTFYSLPLTSYHLLLDTALLLTAHCPLLTAHCPLPLPTAHYPLIIAFCLLLTAYYSLFTTHHPLLTAHCSHCPLLPLFTAHCALRTARCSLHTIDG